MRRNNNVSPSRFLSICLFIRFLEIIQTEFYVCVSFVSSLEDRRNVNGNANKTISWLVLHVNTHRKRYFSGRRKKNMFRTKKAIGQSFCVSLTISSFIQIETRQNPIIILFSFLPFTTTKKILQATNFLCSASFLIDFR